MPSATVIRSLLSLAQGTEESNAPEWLRVLTDWQAANPATAQSLGVAAILTLALLAWLFARPTIRALVTRLSKKTTFEWDDVLVEANVIRRLTWMIPALVALSCYDLEILHLTEDVAAIVRNVSAAVVILSITGTLLAALDAVQLVYRKRDAHKRHPIKGYLQLGKIFIVVIGLIAAVAKLVGAELGSLFVGMGAMTAVLMLVFKDTILAFVASIQITSNDLVRIGDWVEVPNCNADGDVIDIALHTVKVQNWDKTISTVPTYELFSKSFKNWRGMQEGDGRRIKRNLLLDMTHVHFLLKKDIDKLRKIELLTPYLDAKVTELETANADKGKVGANQRRLTNLGTFRAYVIAYLKSLGTINESMTFLVRQLQPTPTGIPLEIYIFTKTKNWVEYEGIQSDIFDHLLAILPEFDLRVFQEPTGAELAEAIAGN